MECVILSAAKDLTVGVVNKPRGVRNSSKGYALLMVCLLAALMIIASAAAVPSLLTQGRRVKEAELIWRGEQYARAVRLYYRKYGRFPQSFEDLAQPKNQIRFLRKPYPDPMNRKDGSWRLIYVGPSGELIGSVKTGSIFARGGTPRPGGAGVFPAPQNPPGVQGVPVPVPPGGETQVPSPGTPAPTEAKAPSPERKVFGGNIIGVASTIEQRSIRIYKGSAVYKEWEFIWDPTAEGVMVGPPGSRPAVPPATQVTPGAPPRRPPQ
jgi:type II secretory pathway pseudopilin PulG